MIATNRSGKSHVITINASFYENVLLLTQMATPSFEFQQHFKKNMFDRPNVVGFLHVSHYLSVIYDAKLFTRMVKWPLVCKKDEVMYRNELRNFLSVLSQDNPDINFPTILTSHLTQAGGTRFLIIMWKMSQLALRVYIKKQFQGELLNMPRTGTADDLTVAYFNSTIAKTCKAAKETHREAKRILDTASNFLKSEMELQNLYKAEIFDRTQNIKKLVSDMSLHALVQEQLMDVEDSNIINIWKRNILKNLQYMRNRNEKFKEFEEFCGYLCELISKIIPNSEVLDANKLPKINDSNRLLHTQDLYTDGSVAFSTLLSLVSLASVQMLRCANIADLPDLLQYLPHIETACKNIKVLRALFIGLNVKLTGIHLDEQRVSEGVTNVHINHDMDNTFVASRDVLLESPEINFDLDQCVEDDYFHKILCLSPVKGKNKRLFKGCKHKYRPHEWPVVFQSDFSESSWNQINGWLSPRAYSFKNKPITPTGKPTSPLYSRLLHSSKPTHKHPTENVLHSPCSAYEQSIQRKLRRSMSGQLTSSKILNGKARNLFNTSTISSSLFIS